MNEDIKQGDMGSSGDGAVSETIQAADCLCCKCNKPAVAFWPCVDPDITSRPYCRDCLDIVKMKALIDMYDAGVER